MNQTKLEGGTERHLLRQTIGVVGSAGERREDVEMKRKSETKNVIKIYFIYMYIHIYI